MSWVYERDAMLGPTQRIFCIADGFLTVDSLTIPDAITLGIFKRDNWEVYNGTVSKNHSEAAFQFRTTYKKVIRRGKKV